MKAITAFILYFIASLFCICQTQVSPIWSTAKVFSVGAGTAQLNTITTNVGYFTVLFPTGFTISTSAIKVPFFGLVGVN
jgi:hypothetical protein